MATIATSREGIDKDNKSKRGFDNHNKTPNAYLSSMNRGKQLPSSSSSSPVQPSVRGLYDDDSVSTQKEKGGFSGNPEVEASGLSILSLFHERRIPARRTSDATWKVGNTTAALTRTGAANSNSNTTCSLSEIFNASQQESCEIERGRLREEDDSFYIPTRTLQRNQDNLEETQTLHSSTPSLEMPDSPVDGFAYDDDDDEASLQLSEITMPQEAWLCRSGQLFDACECRRKMTSLYNDEQEDDNDAGETITEPQPNSGAEHQQCLDKYDQDEDGQRRQTPTDLLQQEIQWRQSRLYQLHQEQTKLQEEVDELQYQILQKQQQQKQPCHNLPHQI